MPGTVITGAAALARDNFKALAGRRLGLITNQTGRVGEAHLADLLANARGIRLVALYGPEHGVRGEAEAGAKVADGRDTRTGLPVFSLYGATRKPTAAMLRGIDALVFDIQDVGVRSYTYISTMGLAMQAAAEAGIGFVVLDRPNPIGGAYVSGFMLEPSRTSFVGQYPIPIVHGMTVAELAVMIKQEGWLPGLENLDLEVAQCEGWGRGDRWPRTGLPWVLTSPNVPSFESALFYPGIGLVGECLVNEGRGTPAPFTRFGAPWLDARRAVEAFERAGFPGLRAAAESYTPRGIPNVAANPRFRDQRIHAVRFEADIVQAVTPLEIGIVALVELQRQARATGNPLFPDRLGMFHAISGTSRLHRAITGSVPAREIILSWQDEVQRFIRQREQYLLY